MKGTPDTNITNVSTGTILKCLISRVYDWMFKTDDQNTKSRVDYMFNTTFWSMLIIIIGFGLLHGNQFNYYLFEEYVDKLLILIVIITSVLCSARTIRNTSTMVHDILLPFPVFLVIDKMVNSYSYMSPPIWLYYALFFVAIVSCKAYVMVFRNHKKSLKELFHIKAIRFLIEDTIIELGIITIVYSLIVQCFDNLFY